MIPSRHAPSSAAPDGFRISGPGAEPTPCEDNAVPVGSGASWREDNLRKQGRCWPAAYVPGRWHRRFDTLPVCAAPFFALANLWRHRAGNIPLDHPDRGWMLRNMRDAALEGVIRLRWSKVRSAPVGQQLFDFMTGDAARSADRRAAADAPRA